MKTFLLSLSLLLALIPAAYAQMGLNAPAGLAPVRDMEIYSRDVFVVQQKYIPTTDPISGTFTMSCAASPPNLTATAGVLLDPGGTGNYLASLTCTQTIVTPGNPATTPGLSLVGYELTFTQFGTEANGDSVVIEGLYDGRIAFSGSALPPVLLVPGYQFKIIFKADTDGNVGTGFVLRWRRVNIDPDPTGAGDEQFGKSLQFDLIKGALVGGLNGLGTLQRAGNYSTALGRRNMASGYGAVALGVQNTVRGDGAIALGSVNAASGDDANALGFNNIASGDKSTAIGNFVSTAGRSGAMILGDFSTFTRTLATADNQLMARFAGGYRFFTNSGLTTGVAVSAGGTSWATISDSTRKERFLPIDGPDLLRKISGLKLTTWNYKGQRDRRHYGPMAQEFFALFGQDELGPIGCDTLITTQDIEGLTLSAVQALVRENEALKAKLIEVESQNERLRVETQDFASRLHLLERAVLTRRERVSLRRSKP